MKTFIFFLALFFSLPFILFAQRVVVLQPGPEDSMDVTIRSDIPDSINDRCYEADLGAWTFGGVFGVDRAFIRFDLSGIPSDAIVISAKLSLYANDDYTMFPNGHYGDNGWAIQRITSPWNGKTLTWFTIPSATEQGQVILPHATNLHQDFTDIDVLQMVKGMVAEPEANFGFMFKVIKEEVYKMLLFCSNDYPGADHRPKLVVKYSFCYPPQTAFYYESQYNTISFHDTSTTTHLISRLWSFGDGDTSSAKDPVHYYNGNSSTYIACLTVTDSCATSTICDTINISLPLVRFTQHFVPTTEKLIQFTGNVENADQWNWNFDDGSTSTEMNPSHLFPSTGRFKVCLTAGNSFGSGSHCDSVEVLPLILYSGHNLAILCPNPTSGRVFLQVSDDTGASTMEIYSIEGKKLNSFLFNELKHYQPVEVNLERLANGLYFANLRYGDNIKLFRLVIRH